jgi:hypothetical protein
MVVGFTTIFAIGAYRHWCCGFDSRSGRGVQHYVIKFVSDLRQFFFDLQILITPLVLFVCLMVLNATFNNSSVISWRSVLLVEETG